jgi:hypothetical protein
MSRSDAGGSNAPFRRQVVGDPRRRLEFQSNDGRVPGAFMFYMLRDCGLQVITPENRSLIRESSEAGIHAQWNHLANLSARTGSCLQIFSKVCLF